MIKNDRNKSGTAATGFAIASFKSIENGVCVRACVCVCVDVICCDARKVICNFDANIAFD